MFEEYLVKISEALGAYSGYIYYIFGGVLVAVIVGYLLYYLTFNRIIIIKERVGQEFDFDIGSKAIIEDNKPSIADLRAMLEKGETKKPVRTIKAIQTVNKTMRGKVVKKKNKYFLLTFRFLQKSMKLKLFGSMYWGLAGNKRRIELLKLSEHIYAPLVVAFDNDVYLKAHHDEDYIDWVVTDIEEDKRKYVNETFWDRYGGAIMIMATFVLCLIFVVVVFKNMNEFAEAGKQASQVLANACSQATTQKV